MEKLNYVFYLNKKPTTTTTNDDVDADSDADVVDDYGDNEDFAQKNIDMEWKFVCELTQEKTTVTKQSKARQQLWPQKDCGRKVQGEKKTLIRCERQTKQKNGMTSLCFILSCDRLVHSQWARLKSALIKMHKLN